MSSEFPDVPEPEDIQGEYGEDLIQPQSETESTGEEASSSPESSLPPEAQGETNGGPLGCCLGIVVGLLFSLLLSTTLAILLTNGRTLSFPIITIPTIIIGTILCSYFGWKIGKKVYREYEQPVVKERRRTRKSRTNFKRV